MPLTDQAMAAQGAPMPPQGGAPMDPAMMGGMPPQGAPMPPPGGAPMPPQGGMPPVDPNTGMPIDPNTGMPIDPNAMAGGMPSQGAPMPPPQGGAPISTGDMVIDMLLEMGAMIVDPSGQPVPPEMIAQMVQEMNAQTGGQPPQEGGQPGAPQDPNGDAVLETMAQLDKNVSVMLDKLDSIRAIVDDLRGAGENIEGKSSDKGDPNEIDPELAAFLAEQAAANQAPEEPMPTEGMPPEAGAIDPQQAEQLGLMQAMQAMQAGGY